MEKRCNKCLIFKAYACFGKDKHRPDGFDDRCKLCKSVIAKESRLRNIETARERSRLYHINNREKRSKYKRDQRSIKTPEERNAPCRKWAQANKWRVNLIAANKRARRRNATPKWLTKEHWDQIKNLYFNCPHGYQVDHIVPLAATASGNRKEYIACGLHVPWNLQYLLASENASKCSSLLV